MCLVLTNSMALDNDHSPLLGRGLMVGMFYRETGAQTPSLVGPVAQRSFYPTGFHALLGNRRLLCEGKVTACVPQCPSGWEMDIIVSLLRRDLRIYL